ncbi:hypothetical protein [Bradyrhizobium stylosanthis]|uniref:Pentapeptide MXKDX repeat protein n=1 Tax=Bradyrhizobium stylosanthis TaxID=1803665 RepID=A0A560DJF5_9BRAD|nr:hypothetical protein [Bradyrhizobium stylosanthis]TWA97245.1 hypothetical protein FBZ96_106297 [Bradyrhizobium stylosanthis]
MEFKHSSIMKRHALAVAMAAVVASIAAGSLAMADDRPATPPAQDKMGMGADGHDMMGMGSNGSGAMSGMKAMKCCGQGGMSRAGQDSDKKQDEKK